MLNLAYISRSSDFEIFLIKNLFLTYQLKHVLKLIILSKTKCDSEEFLLFLKITKSINFYGCFFPLFLSYVNLPVRTQYHCFELRCSPVVYNFRDLFNAAFVSCWTELTETQQDELIQSLEQALTSQEIPEITQTLLNLAEFMEHCDKVL